ncbi:hypothetical protein K9N50_03250 [bacterium]|nr:hypothetical protein [bacterium]
MTLLLIYIAVITWLLVLWSNKPPYFKINVFWKGLRKKLESRSSNSTNNLTLFRCSLYNQN